MTPESGNPKQDFRTVLRILWRWKLLFLALLVIPPVVAYLLVRNKPKEYQSSALVSLTSTPGVTGLANPSDQNVLAVVRLVTTSSVERVAARLMKPPAAPGSLGGVSASADTDTGFITISATNEDPARAAAVANAFAQALSVHQRDVALANINTQIKTLQGQLAALPKNDPLTSQLRQQLAQLKGQQGAQGAGATIQQAAAPSSTPVGPHIRRDVEIGVVIGLLLAIGAVLLAENSDRRLRTSDDMEAVTGMPLLGAIPKVAFSERASDRATESFQMLRTALTYFNVDRRLSSVAIVSPEGQDGKTTVAVGVATATARAGRHVILLDGDLRLPQVAERFGLDPTQPGLGAVLAGEVSLVDALVDVAMDAEHAGRLQVLPAGPAPPNPAALVGSDEMRQLINRLESLSELVVVDTPAALAVSDALPLVQWVSGAVLVARANRSSRAAVRRLQKMILAAHGTVLGVVATGTGGTDGYGYAYGRYEDGHRARGLRNRLRRRRPRAEVSGPAHEPRAEHDATREIRVAQHEGST